MSPHRRRISRLEDLVTTTEVGRLSGDCAQAQRMHLVRPALLWSVLNCYGPPSRVQVHTTSRKYAALRHGHPDVPCANRPKCVPTLRESDGLFRTILCTGTAWSICHSPLSAATEKLYSVGVASNLSEISPADGRGYFEAYHQLVNGWTDMDGDSP